MAEFSQGDLIARIRDVRDGEALTPALATALLACDGDTQEELLAAAADLKERYRPGVVTYSRKVFPSADESLSRLLRILYLQARSG